MTRALAHCRWCGTPTARHTTRQGRPPTFCSDTHRRLHHHTFHAPAYDGAIQLTHHCTDGCPLNGDTHAMPGPVRAPGAWANAATEVATALHGHPVTVQVAPIDQALDPALWTAAAVAPHHLDAEAHA